MAKSCVIHIYSVSVFRYRLSKNGFASPKSFRGFRETGTTIFSYQNIFLRELKEIRLSTKRLIEDENYLFHLSPWLDFKHISFP